MKIFRQGQFVRNPLFQNTVALYGIQLCRKLAPIVVIPYLARVLGVAGWGGVAFSLSVGMFLMVVVEFGFPLSAAREVARTRDNKDTSRKVVSGVICSQLLLALAGSVAVFLLSPIIPNLSDRLPLLAGAVFFGVAQGLTPFWFFQGMERLKTAAVLDMVGKLIGMAGILLLVRSPDDDWKALVLQGMGPLVTTGAGYFLIVRSGAVQWPVINDLKAAFQAAWSPFIYRLSTGLSGTATVFILGTFEPLHVVGYFAAAEKISSATLGLLNPIHEAFYPRISHLAANALDEAARLARIGAVVLLAGGFILSASLAILAQPIIATVMGPGFEMAVPALRIMSLIVLFGSLANISAMQWLMPLGYQAVVSRIVIGSGLLNIFLTAGLAVKFAHLGAAWGAVLAEAYMVAQLFRAAAKLAPFWIGNYGRRGISNPSTDTLGAANWKESVPEH